MEGLTGRAFRAIVFFLATVSVAGSAAQAVTLPDPPATNGGLFGSFGFISVLSSLSIPWQTENAQYTLADGTKLGGVLYVDPDKGTRPLVIADFGLMNSTNSALAADVISKIVTPGLLNANFLVVDDISGADFYDTNRSLSLGGYDAGRVLNELADAVRADGVPFSSLVLMGESLGGLAVLEALVEDRRLGTHHFQSAITFSGVTDELPATGTVMAAFGHDLSEISGPALSAEGMVFLTSAVAAFDTSVVFSGSGLTAPSVFSAGDLFYDQFTQRLQNVNPVDWNPDVSRTSVESYLESSAPLVGQIGGVSAPVILVHAQNDPVVAYSQFESFAQSQADNPRVLTLGTSAGSHCGFVGVYGASWVAGLVNQAIGMH